MGGRIPTGWGTFILWNAVDRVSVVDIVTYSYIHTHKFIWRQNRENESEALKHHAEALNTTLFAKGSSDAVSNYEHCIKLLDICFCGSSVGHATRSVNLLPC